MPGNPLLVAIVVADGGYAVGGQKQALNPSRGCAYIQPVDVSADRRGAVSIDTPVQNIPFKFALR